MAVAPVYGAVIVEFDTSAAAKAAYDPLYKEALKHRLKDAEYCVFIIDGVDTARSTRRCCGTRRSAR